jgi:hypothetical protein
MPISLNESSAALTDKLVSFLWGQWSTLGLAGYANSETPCITDPEALLLLSTTIARHDSRLFDEVLDWLRENESWLNLQRLRHLMKEYPFGEPTILGAMAERLTQENPHSKWKFLVRHIPMPVNKEPEPMFLPARFFGEPEPVFLRWGWLRGPVEFRKMSQPPRTDQPAAFLFKLRALFGNQARAEIMAWLLANELGHPAEIARQTGYFRRTVQLVLNELAASGHVRATRVGREKNFAIHRDDWRFLLNWSDSKNFPEWINWAPLFHAILLFRQTLALPGIDEKSERFQGIKLREALDEAMPALVRAGIAHKLLTTRTLSGANLVESLITDIDSLLG